MYINSLGRMVNVHVTNLFPFVCSYQYCQWIGKTEQKIKHAYDVPVHNAYMCGNCQVISRAPHSI